jgi:S-(hydroxymethyl)glutathione dehydrogenase/alcohol dehydrogenase
MIYSILDTKIKNTMKAAILVETKQPLIVAEIDLPRELKYGQVLVKVHYSSICGSQINEIEGAKGEDKYLPHLLGHEGVATVIEVGAGVKKISMGDTVIMHWRLGEGIQSESPIYKWGNHKVNAGSVTTFNEYAVVSENRLTRVSEDIDPKLASLFGCAVTTAMGVINNDAKVKIGESVVIFGIGGVGLNIAQAAAMVSAYPIVGIDLNDDKLTLARQFGLTHTINAKTERNVVEQIKKIIGQKGADVVIDTTGNTKIIADAYNLTQDSGRTILVGVPKQGDNTSIYTLPLHFNKILTGSHGGNSQPHEDIPRYLRLLKEGKLKLQGLFTQEILLDDINDAIDAMKNGQVTGRVLIKL